MTTSTRDANGSLAVTLLSHRTPEFIVAYRELSPYGSAMLDRAIIVPDASALLRLMNAIRRIVVVT
jgi:hypothetical protein